MPRIAISAFDAMMRATRRVSRCTAFPAHADEVLAARERLPAVYAGRFFVTAGGLICGDPDRIEQYRPAAGYVDRILKGEKPADLPVQARPSTI
jgi:ABC-type uncharacterized transport system substrate-binding protein